MNPVRFDGRVAIVTGGGRGAGAAFAQLLAARGAAVVVNDLGSASHTGEGGGSRAPSEEIAARICAAGGRAVANADTVATQAGARAIVQIALDAFGRVDIVIHSAGTTRYDLFPTITREAFEQQLAVHVGGAFGVFQAAWPHMAQRRYGRLLAISSGSGYYGHATQAHYAAAKMAQIGLIRVLGVEGTPYGIRANALGIGAYTRMLHEVFKHDPATLAWWRNYMKVEYVAAAAAWLVHEECGSTAELFQAVGPRVTRVCMGETRGYTNLQLTVEDVRDHFAEVLRIDEVCFFEGGQPTLMGRHNVLQLIAAGAEAPPPFAPPPNEDHPFAKANPMQRS
jgi:NAD(P)-dependent dehydrogenase (short-subunit alcohol dehydrogenase family)